MNFKDGLVGIPGLIKFDIESCINNQIVYSLLVFGFMVK